LLFWCSKNTFFIMLVGIAELAGVGFNHYVIWQKKLIWFLYQLVCAFIFFNEIVQNIVKISLKKLNLLSKHELYMNF